MKKGQKHTEETKAKMRQSQAIRKPRLEKPCEQCECPTKNTRFCSNKCKGLWMREALKGKGNPQWNGGKIEVPCEQCGNPIPTYQWRVDRGLTKYCSPECKNLVQSENQKGEKNPAWKGGITPLHVTIRMSKEYAEWRKAVFARDNWTCQDCGDNSGGNLQGHHIFPFADFPEHRFAVWNGITLCEKCHNKAHPGLKSHDREGVVNRGTYS